MNLICIKYMKGYSAREIKTHYITPNLKTLYNSNLKPISYNIHIVLLLMIKQSGCRRLLLHVLLIRHNNYVHLLSKPTISVPQRNTHMLLPCPQLAYKMIISMKGLIFRQNLQIPSIKIISVMIWRTDQTRHVFLWGMTCWKGNLKYFICTAV